MNPLRFGLTCLAVCFAVALGGCAGASGAQAAHDDQPDERVERASGPFEVAQAWAQAPVADALFDDVRLLVKDWRAGQVARVWAEDGYYLALVHNYTTARDAPAVRLTIARDEDGRWRVVDAAPARTTELWPGF